jgi:hypothetical protein
MKLALLFKMLFTPILSLGEIAEPFLSSHVGGLSECGSFLENKSI